MKAFLLYFDETKSREIHLLNRLPWLFLTFVRNISLVSIRVGCSLVWSEKQSRELP
jgi:hypothetical protein